MEFKYSNANDYALTTRNMSYRDISDWIHYGELDEDMEWITFPLSKVAYAIGHEEDGWDGKPKKYAEFVLDCGEHVYALENDNIRSLLAKTMWKNIFGPEEGEEGETNEDD